MSFKIKKSEFPRIQNFFMANLKNSHMIDSMNEVFNRKTFWENNRQEIDLDFFMGQGVSICYSVKSLIEKNKGIQFSLFNFFNEKGENLAEFYEKNLMEKNYAASSYMEPYIMFIKNGFYKVPDENIRKVVLKGKSETKEALKKRINLSFLIKDNDISADAFITCVMPYVELGKLNLNQIEEIKKRFYVRHKNSLLSDENNKRLGILFKNQERIDSPIVDSERGNYISFTIDTDRLSLAKGVAKRDCDIMKARVEFFIKKQFFSEKNKLKELSVCSSFVEGDKITIKYLDATKEDLVFSVIRDFINYSFKDLSFDNFDKNAEGWFDKILFKYKLEKDLDKPSDVAYKTAKI